ncbi:cytochrome P450 1A3-like [Delphinus delphis]|uniref:cytochrome P450 1A3-like n=1 Tax=Delphinus delphis TaxID=9728 RepID=UPI003752EE39
MKSTRFEDRKILPSTEAFINEIFRHASFLPFTVLHCEGGGMSLTPCGNRQSRMQCLSPVLQQLKLEKCPEAELDLTPMYGLAMKPTPYQLQVETRCTEFYFSLKESVLKKQDVLSTHIPRIPFWSEVSC